MDTIDKLNNLGINFKTHWLIKKRYKSNVPFTYCESACLLRTRLIILNGYLIIAVRHMKHERIIKKLKYLRWQNLTSKIILGVVEG